ncbi:MAG: sugar nucleotide-binding protein [Pseudomonadota bacterium]
MLHVDVLIQCIEKVIDNNIYDEFNISGDDIVSRFDFVSEIKSHIPSSKSVVTETDSSGFKTAARRPLDTSFDNQKMKSLLDVHPATLSNSIEALVADAMGRSLTADEMRKAA